MISCHASPVALLKHTQITVKVHTQTSTQSGCKHCVTVMGAGVKCYQQLLNYLWCQNFYNKEAGLPEEEGQSLEKGLEVVVVIDGSLFI